MEGIIDRLRFLVNHFAGGSTSEFARQVGCSPQYVTNLLNGNSSFGMRPALLMLQRYPQLEARWLLLGEGAWIRPTIIERTVEHLRQLRELSCFVSVMSADELAEYDSGRVDFPAEVVAHWHALLAKKSPSTS